MSFPSKADREKCWGAKDRYWQCLESEGENKDACTKFRAFYESACPTQWVKHFDRKRTYLQFKDKIENDGSNSSSMNETEVLHNHRHILSYTKHHNLFASARESKKCDTKLAQDCCTLLLAFLKESKKQYRLSCDIAYAFCLVSSSLIPNIVQLYRTISNCYDYRPPISLVQSQESSDELEKYSSILIAGVLKFITTNHSLAFENKNEFSNFVQHVKKHMFNVLSFGGDLYALLHVAEFFLDLVNSENVNSNRFLDDVTSTVMCVVMNFWNHHISEVRTRVYKLSIACLKLSYENALKETSYRNTFTVIVNLKLFKAFANDMFWSVPYKYFAYSAGLDFFAQFSSVSKFLLCVKEDLEEGFNKSLQNKRVISSETELFKQCTQYLSLDEWTQIFQPVVNRVISSDNIIIANNFSRFWLPVILKKYPQYAEILWNVLPRKSSTQKSIPHSRILFALLKVCHKYRIRLPINDTAEHFLDFLESCFGDAEDVRGELFSLLCNLYEQSIVPSEHELRLILKFLRLNAHSSSTILRQQVFSSFASLVLRLNCSAIKTLKANECHKLEPLLKFLKDLHGFFTEGMQPSCSYQRKITSLTLYKIFMTYSVASCGADLRRNNLKDTEKFVAWLKQQNCWSFTNDAQFAALFRSLMDPCSEIQNVSFVLLSSYFDLTSITKSAPLFEEALTLLRNNQFYKRQSGVVAVLSMICLAYNTKPEIAPKLLLRPDAPYSNFTEMFLQILRKQIDSLGTDMLYSAIYEPLDATIRVLTYLMADKVSPEYGMTTEFQIESLIRCLEDIVPLLLKALFVDDFADYAPSFEESDNALQQILETSKISNELELQNSKEEEFQLKPLYQILQNFIWISLKACCECESKLVVSRDHLDKASMIRCSDLIVKKLKLCRHKGVIEAAGIALSDVVQVLTVRNICEEWLDITLMNVINLIETRSSASISRKSAGLSLLIQNIVGNDKRANKPLLIKCWTEFRRILDVDYEKIEMSVSRELPQTHALHFLRVLIADARNSADLVPYFEKITILSIKTLKTPFWILRNASLQLFGAVLPKIVGQKNKQNDFGVRRSFEEIFSCMPRLLDLVLLSLEKFEEKDSCNLISHSNIVPLLVLLSNVQVGSVNAMGMSSRTKLFQLRRYVKSLLGNEMYQVRKLAGKAFISLHSKEEIVVFKHIYEEIIERLLNLNRNENLVHGQLLLLQQAFSTHAQVTCFRKKVLENLVCHTMPNTSRNELSFMSETILNDLGINVQNSDWKVNVEDIKQHLYLLSNERHLSMGYDELTQILLRRTFEKCDEQSHVEALEVFLNDPNLIIVENTLKVFPINNILSNRISNIVALLCDCIEFNLRSRDNLVDRVTILNLTFEILLKIPHFEYTSVKNFCDKNYDLLKNLSLYEFQANNLQLLSLFLSPLQPLWVHETLIKLHNVLYINNYNKDMRLNAAQGIRHLCNVARQNPKNLKIIWNAIIDMLLDEEIDIRIIGCQCIQLFKPSVMLCSFHEAMTTLFNFDLITIFLSPNEIVDTLLERIWPDDDNEYLAMIKYSNDEIANPFDQSTCTYEEDIDVVKRCGKAIRHLIEENKKEYFKRSTKLLNDFCDLDIILQKCEYIVENGFLITAEGYRIALRFYYLLVLGTELYKWDLISEFRSYHNFDFKEVFGTLERLEDCFYWKDMWL